MSDEVPHEQEHDEAGPSGPVDSGDHEETDEVPEDEPAEHEPQGAEVLLPKSNWLRIAWVFVAVLWVLAMIAIFVQSCAPR